MLEGLGLWMMQVLMSLMNVNETMTFLLEEIPL